MANADHRASFPPPPPPSEDTPVVQLRNAIASAASAFVSKTGVCPIGVSIRWTNSKSGTNCLENIEITFNQFDDISGGGNQPVWPPIPALDSTEEKSE